MAEQAGPRSAQPRWRDPAPERSALRHPALERRAAAQASAGYGALLGTRPPGPRPVQPGGVVQRYVAEGGAKASRGNGLFLAAPRELYAGDVQFNEANAIGGDVRYLPEGAHPERSALHKVVPEVNPDSELGKATRPPAPQSQSSSSAAASADGYSEAEDQAWVRDRATQAARRQVLTALEAEQLATATNLSDTDKLAKYGTVDPDDIEIETEKEARQKLRAKPELLANSPIMARLNAYLVSQEGGGNPLMPSDCHSAATFIAGFDPDEGEEVGADEKVLAGDVYRMKPNEGRQAAAEWTAHYGTVIMTDGPDHVTMENAGAKESEGFQKLKFDRTWFFEMYGPEEDQSFADKYGQYF